MADQDDIKDSALQFERSLQDGIHYELSLYIAGASVHSARAVRVMKDICAVALRNRCKLHVIDIYKFPDLARQAQIIAVPTLVRMAPSPVRKLIGDLSDRERVLHFLEIPAAAGEATA